MLFGLEQDLGYYIQCYLIPDAGGTTPSVLVSDKGREVAKITADDVRQGVVDAGRHATGQVGFNIDEANVPGLTNLIDLELRESETGFLIYRRPRPVFLENTKVFRLETHLLPLWRFDDAFEDRLQYWYKGVERLGLETATQLFMLNKCSSAYISGRLQFMSIETHLTDFKSLILLRDPYHELAERLIVLKNLPDDRQNLLGARDVLTFQPVVEFLRDTDDFNEKFCKNLMRWAPEDVLKILANPVARQLASPNADETPMKNALAAALQALSTFDVVGVREDSEFFSRSVSEVLDVGRPLPVLNEYKKVVEFGEMLRNLSRADTILEKDLEIFEHVKLAFDSAAKPIGVA